MSAHPSQSTSPSIPIHRPCTFLLDRAVEDRDEHRHLRSDGEPEGHDSRRARPAGIISQAQLSSSRPAESPSKRVLDVPWILSRPSLVVDGWASPAHPSPSNRGFDGIPLGFGWASVGRFQPKAWSPLPPGSPSCRGGPLERHRVNLGRLGRFVFRNPV